MSLLVEEFSDEEMARDWTLTDADLKLVSNVISPYRLYFAIQLCAVRLQGSFLPSVSDLSPRIINYLSSQIGLLLTLSVNEPTRRATRSQQYNLILKYLGFKKFDRETKILFADWVISQAKRGILPKDILDQSERFLLRKKTLSPSRNMLERQINSLCAKVHSNLFETIYRQIPSALKKSLNDILLSEENRTSFFSQLKESPPSARISTLKLLLERYKKLEEITLDDFDSSVFSASFADYLFKLAKYYNAADLKRFNKYKRFALLIYFLVEIRKELLDNLVKMHDQFVTELLRRTRNRYEKKHKQNRRENKRAVDVLLSLACLLLDENTDSSLQKEEIVETVGKERLQHAADNLQKLQYLSERGYADLLISHYPSLRKYFADFLQLPFAAEEGSEDLIKAIEIIRRLDRGELNNLPSDAPVSFIPKEVKPALKTKNGQLNRNAWEMGLAMAIKENMRSGNLYLPKSKQYISFWKMLLEKQNWEAEREEIYALSNHPLPEQSTEFIEAGYNQAIKESGIKFRRDKFARIENGKLNLSREQKSETRSEAKKLQTIINSGLPFIRIENLLMEVDAEIGFSRHFTPLQKYETRPANFYKALISAIISQATNLGIVAMSSSVEGVSVDMLRYILNGYIREETLMGANTEIVNGVEGGKEQKATLRV